MANSSIITSLKNKVIQSIVDDDSFFYAIDPNLELEDLDGNKVENPSDLVGKYIFNFNKNPETIIDTQTFLTIMADTNHHDSNKLYVTPTLTIWIYSHHQHMYFTNEQSRLLGFDKRITDNRNDYIGKLLDRKFNGTAEGIGTLRLLSNTEGNAGQSFLYRRLIFDTIDLNNSLCGGD